MLFSMNTAASSFCITHGGSLLVNSSRGCLICPYFLIEEEFLFGMLHMLNFVGVFMTPITGGHAFIHGFTEGFVVFRSFFAIFPLGARS